MLSKSGGSTEPIQSRDDNRIARLQDRHHPRKLASVRARTRYLLSEDGATTVGTQLLKLSIEALIIRRHTSVADKRQIEAPISFLRCEQPKRLELLAQVRCA
jgi:hypothetical protein